MPNHCINEIIFRNVVAGAQAKILEATCNSDGEVDFGILVPIPLQVAGAAKRAVPQDIIDFSERR